MAGLWFSPSTPVSSTNKTDHHDITEILLKVVLNTITITIYRRHYINSGSRQFSVLDQDSFQYWIITIFNIGSRQFSILDHNNSQYWIITILNIRSRQFSILLIIAILNIGLRQFSILDQDNSQ
jgi:hypothetical protein